MKDLGERIERELRRMNEHHEQGRGFDRESERFEGLEMEVASRAMRHRANEHWIQREMTRVYVRGLLRAADMLGAPVKGEWRTETYATSEIRARLGVSFREVLDTIEEE